MKIFRRTDGWTLNSEGGAWSPIRQGKQSWFARSLSRCLRKRRGIRH